MTGVTQKAKVCTIGAPLKIHTYITTKYKQNIATLHIYTSKIQQPTKCKHLQHTQYL